LQASRLIILPLIASLFDFIVGEISKRSRFLLYPNCIVGEWIAHVVGVKTFKREFPRTDNKFLPLFLLT